MDGVLSRSVILLGLTTLVDYVLTPSPQEASNNEANRLSTESSQGLEVFLRHSTHLASSSLYYGFKAVTWATDAYVECHPAFKDLHSTNTLNTYLAQHDAHSWSYQRTQTFVSQLIQQLLTKHPHTQAVFDIILRMNPAFNAARFLCLCKLATKAANHQDAKTLKNCFFELTSYCDDLPLIYNKEYQKAIKAYQAQSHSPLCL